MTTHTPRALSMLLAAMLFAGCSFYAKAAERNGVKDGSKYSSSSAGNEDMDSAPSGSEGAQAEPSVKVPPWRFEPFGSIGIALRAGIGGLGVDVATPLTPKFNLRAGFDYFKYGYSFREEGADINAELRLSAGHASLDWFPFGGRFRLSPTIVFANNNKAHATALVPPGTTLSLNGEDYVSSTADPLHGSGTVTFRKTSPGLTLGFGNIIPRKRSHFSIPFEAGFYYVNQPRLSIDFSGKACDPGYSQDIGCSEVTDDPGFQHDLAAFIARNNHNLSYASFYPVISIGFGYTF